MPRSSANTCPQITELGVFAGPVSVTEDCLFLNVFTPSQRCGSCQWQEASGPGLDPWRRTVRRREQRLRRERARQGRPGRPHRRRHDQLPARPAGLLRASRDRRRRPSLRQLRTDGPAGRAAMGAAQYRGIRRRSRQRHGRRPVGRLDQHRRLGDIAGERRPVPPGHLRKRSVAHGRATASLAEQRGSNFAAAAGCGEEVNGAAADVPARADGAEDPVAAGHRARRTVRT